MRGRPPGRDQPVPQGGPVPVLTHVGLGLGQHAHEAGLDIGPARGREQIQGAPGRSQAVQGLDAGNVIEKPGTAGKTGQGLALHEQQPAGVRALRGVKSGQTVPVQKKGQLLGLAQDQPVLLQGLCAVVKKVLPFFEILFVNVIFQIVETTSERSSPVLNPVRVPPVRATAMGFPTLHPMHAAPGGVFVDERLVHGRMLGKIGGVIGEAETVAPLSGLLYDVSQGHLPELEMVPIGFAVRGYVAQAMGQRAGQAGPEVLAAAEQPFESHCPGHGPVIKKHAYGLAFREPDQIGPRGVEAVFGHGMKCPVIAAHGLGLARGQDGEPDAPVGQGLERGQVHGRLGQPHAFGVAAKACPEILDGPGYFQALVHFRGQGHDGVMIHLSQGVAMAKAKEALPVPFEDAPVGFGGVELHPAQEGGPEVEAHPCIAVYHFADHARTVQPPRPAQGSIALPGDARVPVVFGGGAALGQHVFEPGVETGRLVEMTVNADRFGHGNSKN